MHQNKILIQGKSHIFFDFRSFNSYKAQSFKQIEKQVNNTSVLLTVVTQRV